MFRKYNENDIDFIVELEKKTLNSTLDKSFYQGDLDNNLAYHYVFECEDLVGFISSVFDGECAEILNFCVEPRFQGRGYGFKILDLYFKEIYSMSAKNVVLEVRSSNLVAINLYQKCGFKTIRIRKSYYSNGEDALFMNLELDDYYGKN